MPKNDTPNYTRWIQDMHQTNKKWTNRKTSLIVGAQPIYKLIMDIELSSMYATTQSKRVCIKEDLIYYSHYSASLSALLFLSICNIQKRQERGCSSCSSSLSLQISHHYLCQAYFVMYSSRSVLSNLGVKVLSKSKIQFLL